MDNMHTVPIWKLTQLRWMITATTCRRYCERRTSDPTSRACRREILMAASGQMMRLAQKMKQRSIELMTNSANTTSICRQLKATVALTR